MVNRSKQPFMADLYIQGQGDGKQKQAAVHG